MTLTNFPNGVSSFGIPAVGQGAGAQGGGNIPTSSGNYYFVSSTLGNNGNAGSFDSPFATLAFAAAYPPLAANDVIVLLPSHAETVIAAGTITLNDANIRVVGLGNGDNRPKFTFSTATTASILISAANVSIDNILGVSGINSLANPIDITGNDCTITNFDWEDVAATYEAAHVIRAVSVDDLTIQLRMKGLTGGSLSTSAIYLSGCSEVEIFLDYYGKSSVAAVNFYTTASNGVRVFGNCYISGTTNSSKIVVDTVGGSTWWAEVFDGSAGSFVAGGSATSGSLTPASNTALGNALYGTGVASWPASAAHANSVSIAAVLGYVQDSLQAASGSGIASWPASAAYANGKSLAAAIGYLQDNLINGTGTVLTTNYSLFDQISGTKGVAVWPASAGHGNGVNLAQVLGYVQDTAEKCVATTAATMTAATDTIFTVAGGPILLLQLVGVFQTVNTGAASTFAIQSNATAGGATALSTASASTSGAAAGTMLTLAATVTGTLVTTAGTQIAVYPTAGTGWIIPVGTIQAIVGTAGTVGTVQWYLRYKPLAPGVTVTAGY